MNRRKATLLICMLGFFLGLILTAGSGIYWVEIMDHFISNFALVIIGLFECLIFAYIFGGEKIRKYANEVSEIKIGRWWNVFLKLIAPVILISLAIASIVELLTEGYENFPSWALAIGIIVVIFGIIISITMVRIKCRQAQ